MSVQVNVRSIQEVVEAGSHLRAMVRTLTVDNDARRGEVEAKYREEVERRVAESRGAVEKTMEELRKLDELCKSYQSMVGRIGYESESRTVWGGEVISTCPPIRPVGFSGFRG